MNDLIQKMMNFNVRADIRVFYIKNEYEDKSKRLKKDFYRKQRKPDFLLIAYLFFMAQYSFFLDKTLSSYCWKNLKLYCQYLYFANKIYKEYDYGLNAESAI